MLAATRTVHLDPPDSVYFVAHSESRRFRIDQITAKQPNNEKEGGSLVQPHAASVDGHAASPALPPEQMSWVPGGTFLMGSDDFYPEERPAHHVAVDGFWIDEHPATNAEFARFVAATGYVTVA